MIEGVRQSESPPANGTSAMAPVAASQSPLDSSDGKSRELRTNLLKSSRFKAKFLVEDDSLPSHPHRQQPQVKQEDLPHRTNGTDGRHVLDDEDLLHENNDHHDDLAQAPRTLAPSPPPSSRPLASHPHHQQHQQQQNQHSSSSRHQEGAGAGEQERKRPLVKQEPSRSVKVKKSYSSVRIQCKVDQDVASRLESGSLDPGIALSLRMPRLLLPSADPHLATLKYGRFFRQEVHPNGGGRILRLFHDEVAHILRVSVPRDSLLLC